MKTYTAKNRAEETLSLYSDDTFTMAIGSPETESEETTPQSLHAIFDSVAIAGLMRQVLESGQGQFSQDYQKLQAAWDLGELPSYSAVSNA